MAAPQRQPWNKGKLVGQKAPLTLRDIWAIRILANCGAGPANIALFKLAINSRLRACDLANLRVYFGIELDDALEMARQTEV
ncbi:MAG: hypothetical protein ACREPL_11295 [Rhodanobacteraceae bacterium]